MTATQIYPFLRHHPELSLFVHDFQFVESAAAAALNEDDVSRAMVHALIVVRDRVVSRLLDELYRVSPITRDMDPELTFTNGEAVVRLATPTSVDASRN